MAGVGEKTYVRWSGKVCCLSQDPKEIVSESWRTYGVFYAGCTVSPSGRHIPAVWKPQTGICDSKCELTGMGSAVRAHGMLTFTFSELDR